MAGRKVVQERAFVCKTNTDNEHYLGMERDGTGIDTAIGQLTELQSAADKLHIDDNSRLFNSNLVEALRRRPLLDLQLLQLRAQSRGQKGNSSKIRFRRNRC